MAYLSPFKFFPFLKLDLLSIEGFDYQILKRKILAEYELNDNQPIKVGNSFIGKSEALNFLEKLRDPDILKQHIFLAKCTDLLNFIESGDFTFFKNSQNYSVDLPILIHSDFAQILGEQLARCYQFNYYNEFDLLIRFPISNLKTDVNPYEFLFKKIKSDLILLNEIDQCSDLKTKTSRLSTIIQNFSFKRAMILNLLPIEFSYLKDYILNTCINISSEIFNKTNDKFLALELCKFAVRINASKDLMEIAKNNLKIMNKNPEGVTWRMYILIIILFVKIVFFISKCSH